MWLVHTTTLQLRSFQGKHPPYAILSHRWGDDEDEVSFQQWRDDHAKISHKPGFVKIDKACEQARADKLEYLWADTCCIDKSSSAELSEAINSMFSFYTKAEVCYAYLQDVHGSGDMDDATLHDVQAVQLPQSNWFTRGWTLQELLAPKNLVFFSSAWSRIGTRDQLSSIVSEVAGIPVEVFQYDEDGEEEVSIFEFSIATRMAWVANRVTTRIEDIAYCMLGILDINMPLLYGEGQRAFQRLQEELIKASDDISIFVWDWLPRFKRTGRHRPNFPHRRVAYLVDTGWDIEPLYASEEMDFRRYRGATDISSGATSMFAPDPVFFFASPRTHYLSLEQDWYDDSTPFFITNKGLSVSLPVHDISTTHSMGSGSLSSTADGMPALAMLCLNGSAIDAARGLWLQGMALFLSPSKGGAKSYTRHRGIDEDGGRWNGMFRGHLLSFSMPSTLFKNFFRLKSVFVRITDGYQSLFTWDQTPEAGVVVLNGPGTGSTIRIALGGIRPEGFSLPGFRTGGQPQRETESSTSGAIYQVTWYRMDAPGVNRFVQFHVLVRAAKRTRPAVVLAEDAESDKDDPFCWSCDLISRSPEGRGCWAVGSRSLTFSEILDLPMEGIDDEPIDHHSVVLRWKFPDKESGKDATMSIYVNLTGRSCWLTNPASSIKFLYVTDSEE